MKRIGKNIVVWLLLLSGVVKLRRFLTQRNSVTIFILHDPSKSDFEAFLTALSAKYNFVAMDEVIRLKTQGKPSQLPKYAAVLTFDDGHKNNFYLLPTIAAFKVPTTFFICSAIVNTHRHFWSNYDLPKQKMEALKKLPNKQMLSSFKELGYEKEKQYPERQALTLEEIKIMQKSGYASFESHTCFHPILTNLNDQESNEEIANSKQQLEDLLGKPITGFAFPNGDYGQREVKFVKQAGYSYSVTVKPGVVRENDDNYRLNRICLNDYGSSSENLVKASGLWKYLKK